MRVPRTTSADNDMGERPTGTFAFAGRKRCLFLQVGTGSCTLQMVWCVGGGAWSQLKDPGAVSAHGGGRLTGRGGMESAGWWETYCTWLPDTAKPKPPTGQSLSFLQRVGGGEGHPFRLTEYPRW